MPTGTTNSHPTLPTLDPGYLESLFQSAGLAILACDSAGRLVAWNAAAARLFAGIPACREGAPVAELFPERDRATIEKHVESCLSTLEPGETRARLGGTETEPIEFALYMTPVLEPDGSLRGAAVWLRDVTARMRLQRALRRRERLTTLGTLAGAVSHHYNNLLFAIAASLEYAINMNTLSAMRRALQRTADAVARGTHINQQLLAFAQADHRTCQESDLSETFQAYFERNKPRLAQRHITLMLDSQPIPKFPIPREQVEIVLNNLVDNAIEVMPNGGTLTATLARRDEHTVLLTIADTGGGISSENLEHLFEPFHTNKGVLAGGPSCSAGMGLAVVHGLVSEMQGTITAANVPGHGARFDIILPLPGSG